jgi:mono/diheme cytochrome c family protein
MRLALLAVLVCCGCGPAPETCPNDLPAKCPTKPPSYRTQVASLLERRCVACHQAGGSAGDRPLDAYDAVFARRSTVLTQIYGCVMPPSDAGALSSGERAVVLGWLVCDAPDN